MTTILEHKIEIPALVASSLVGTWELRHRVMPICFERIEALKVYTFYADGTGVYSHLDAREKYYKDVMPFTYKVDDNKIIVVYGGISRVDTIHFSVEQDKLTLISYNHKEVFTKYEFDN
ncbi:hypothetical protein HCH04_14935 [Bacteroides thetaiotaomicron]|uniref:DUF5640 domain-containing protein n=1 Tax=Bacteroides thetaiotaomicron TaxID=818 RepID=UPI001C8B6C94|nr:DUF5640 domain-containing protein [Bacteroides thetaiotaomicron]MBX9049606.1 hypothetical protein [Bacteroides thetaiotaomicron]MBX9074256.1 hypothetical protein [Bacteroides thetaiotaomicron]